LYFCFEKLSIMDECHGKKFILNGELYPAEQFDKSLVYEGDSIYEVIRIFKGSPVFFADHMARLTESVKLQRKNILADSQMLRKAILALTRADKKKEVNLKIVFNYNNGSENFMVYFIEPIYPSEEQYKKGVKGVLFFAERKEPESKVINHKLRSAISHKLIHESGYEAILVNENKQITEGSRSNIFFLKGEILYTAPDTVILKGITRKHIIEICNENNIKVVFLCIKADEMSDFDAVFMTGTSPMVLPFNRIDDILFNVKNPLMERLRMLYMIRVEDSIKVFRPNIES
jgi:branched-chain amino acid aminotransferase